MKYRKAMIDGTRVWMENHPSYSYAIPHEHHVLPDGSGLDFPNCFDGPTYAHCYHGVIVRFGKTLGRVEDVVVEGWESEVAQ